MAVFVLPLSHTAQEEVATLNTEIASAKEALERAQQSVSEKDSQIASLRSDIDALNTAKEAAAEQADEDLAVLAMDLEEAQKVQHSRCLLPHGALTHIFVASWRPPWPSHRSHHASL